jgi:hypothetical protein
MPAPALPQPWPESRPGKPVAGEARERTIVVGEPHTVTVEAGR